MLRPQPPWGHPKQPRKIPFTRNPLGAPLLRTHQRGSRDTVQNLGRASTALCIQPRVFKNISFCPPDGVYLTENVFMGHAARALFEMVFSALRALFSPGPAARAFLPSGHFASGGELFARPKSSSKTAPSGGPAGPLASLATLLGLSSPVSISEGRGTLCKTWNVSAVPFEATSKNMPRPQPSWSHSKQPRKIPFTRNPLGASLLRTHQRGSRDTVQNLGRVSSSFCGQPPAFSRRLYNAVGVFGLLCILSICGLT